MLYPAGMQPFYYLMALAAVETHQREAVLDYLGEKKKKRERCFAIKQMRMGMFLQPDLQVVYV